MGLQIDIEIGMLDLVGKLPDLPVMKQQGVLCTWQHHKAYLSAHRSWNKALMKLMLMLVVERGLEDVFKQRR